MDSNIATKITDEEGNVVYFDAARSDANGNYAVEASDGKVLYVSDAVEGVLVFEVTEEQVNEKGDINRSMVIKCDKYPLANSRRVRKI